MEMNNLMDLGGGVGWAGTLLPAGCLFCPLTAFGLMDPGSSPG